MGERRPGIKPLSPRAAPTPISGALSRRRTTHTRVAAALLASLAIIQAAGAQEDGTAAVAEELRQLRERIAREMELAELAMQELYPEIGGPAEGAGDIGAQSDGTA